MTTQVKNKLWTKLVQASRDWPAWVAALSGTMSQRTAQGFELDNPSLQVFDKKPKPATEVATSEASAAAPTAAPAHAWQR